MSIRRAAINNPNGYGEAEPGSFFYNTPAHIAICSPFFKADNKTETSQNYYPRKRVRAKK